MNYRNNQIQIISGGQSGVERAALDFALCNGLICSGWCPNGRIADDGKIPPRYPLHEAFSQNVFAHSLQNINECDGICIIIADEMDGNTQLIYDISVDSQKPVFVWAFSTNRNHRIIRRWIDENHIVKLYITGDSEGVTRGMHEETLDLLGEIFPEYLK